MTFSLFKFNYLLFLGAFFFTENTAAQWNIDSIFQLMIFEEIEVYDGNLKLISFEKEPWKAMTSIDTTVNGLWTRPRFLNNILQKGFDGVIIKQKEKLTSSDFISNLNYIDFKIEKFNYIKDRTYWETIFLIKKDYFKKSKSQKLKVNFPKEIISGEYKYWTNDFIKVDGNEIQLDSCHFLYQLKLKEDFSFSQSFSNGNEFCFTQEMENDVEVGVESDIDVKYFEILQGHYIDLPKGVWKIKNNYLYLFSIAKRDYLKYKIQLLKEEILILKIPNSDYFIHLKKVNK